MGERDINDIHRVEGLDAARAHHDSAKPFERERPNGKDAQPPDRGAPSLGEPVEKQKPNFRPLAEFCDEFRPISYAVADLMREGSLYTLTGRTGEGKTSWLVMLALAVVTGRGELIGRKVKKGRVAFATAETPTTSECASWSPVSSSTSTSRQSDATS
jgi:hypothetical protein